jgi:HD-like signal output (HDOD) protein
MLFGKSNVSAFATNRPESWKLELSRLEDLPMFPTWAVEALEVANQPDASLRDLARVIQRDIVLTAGILKLANSSLYCTGREATTVEQAVVRLGIVRCRHAILTVGMRSIWREGTRRLQPRWAQFLWYHSLLVAHIAERLTYRLRFPFQGEEVPAGLAHDLGRMVLAFEHCPAPLARRDDAFLETSTILRLEREQLGTEHGAIGAWFLQMNRLPAFLADVAEYHHSPERATQHRELVQLISIAEDLGNYCYAASHGTFYEPGPQTREWLRRYFGEDTSEIGEIMPGSDRCGMPSSSQMLQQILLEATQQTQQMFGS